MDKKDLEALGLMTENFDESSKKNSKDVAEETPVEDLMHEHGLLNRLLLIYEKLVTKLDTVKNQQITYHVTVIVRKFIQDYHEKTEENYVFPLLLKNKKYVELTNELIKQHNVGRILTTKIMQLSNTKVLLSEADKNKLINYINLFVKLYRYHESREDTIIFAEFRNQLSKKEYETYGEKFEEEEHEKFGDNGYQNFLNIVIMVEKWLGIYDLSKLTIETENQIKGFDNELNDSGKINIIANKKTTKITNNNKNKK